MLVVVAGIKRSGSTWMFNVARIAMGHAGLSPQVGEYDLWRRRPDADLLIKSHRWHANMAEAADVILSSTRPIDEIRSSLARFYGRPPSGREMKTLRRHHRRWERVAGYSLRYECLLANPRHEVFRIVSALGLDVDVDAVYREVSKIRPPETGQDPTTLLFHNHRTSP